MVSVKPATVAHWRRCRRHEGRVPRNWHCENPSEAAISSSTRPSSRGCRLRSCSAVETRAMLLARHVCQYLPREIFMLTRRDGLKWTWHSPPRRWLRGLAFSRPRAAAEPVFKVPPLGYGYDALEPYIDTLTMTVHHNRHHGAYVAALNGLVDKFPGLATTAPVKILIDSPSCRKRCAGPCATMGLSRTWGSGCQCHLWV